MIPARRDFTPSGFFVLRTTLFPYEDLQAWWSDLEAPDTPAEGEALVRAVERDRVLLRERLRSAYRRPELREAIYIASAGLVQSVDAWLLDDKAELTPKLERALVHYWVRACARPTPFGLFAGCSVGRLDEHTHLVLAPRRRYRRHSRFDGEYLELLVTGLLHEPAIREHVVYRPNTSLYRAAGRLRYVQTRVEDGKQGGRRRRTHHLVAVEESDELDAALARAEAGATATELAQAVADDEVTLEDAREYVDELIESQILVADLGSRVTGPEPLDDLVGELRGFPGAEETAAVLERSRVELKAIDSAGLGNDLARYHAVLGRLERLPARAGLPQLQVDMTVPSPAATLGRAVVNDLAKGVEILSRLTPPPKRDALARFRDAFAARYEGRAVPLVEALDEEIGVGEALTGESRGEAGPLLAGLPIPGGGAESEIWTRRDQVLLRILCEALERGHGEVSLTEADLEQMDSREAKPPPGAFAVVARVVAESQEALDRGDYRIHLRVEGPSGARMLGRFCHADPELHRMVKEHLRAEEALDPDAVYAELAHLPSGVGANVLYRPLLREYEIPYLARSGAPAERQIPVNDLLVSVEDDTVVLRSKRLGRRVIPRLTSAQNFHFGSPAVYRFLCLMQSQSVETGLFFDWAHFEEAPFLPRVVAGRLVLARARWRLNRDELDSLASVKGAELLRAVRALRSERGIPRVVTLFDMDRLLPVDLECIASLEACVRLVKDWGAALLLECSGETDGLCVRGPEGRFVHELVVPFVRTAPAGLAHDGRSTTPMRATPGFRRTLTPGSEWLYAKLYTGTATADRLLVDVVAPAVDEVLGSGAADGWFFIRYGDPDFHLRVRVHGHPDALQSVVLPALQRATADALATGLAWRLQIDTYEREVERYGGPDGMVIAEKVFHADSDAVVAILERLEPDDEGADERWRLALCGIGVLLTDFGLDAQVRLAVLQELRERFGREFGEDPVLARALGRRLRRERGKLEPLLDLPHDPEHPLAPGLAVLRERSARLQPLVKQLRALEQGGPLSQPVESLLMSFVHMHVNRLVRSASRAHELVLYDFLSRIHESRAARESARVGVEPSFLRAP